MSLYLARDHIHTLPSGRNLSYSVFGPSTAPALFFSHGFPSSRLEAHGLHKLVQEHDLRLRIVTIDRPGFGRSDFQPGRRIVDHAHDVTSVADSMNLERFAVLGGSGGGPYALACAYAIPDRLSGVGLLASAGPWNTPAGMKDVSWLGYCTYLGTNYVPGAFTVFMDGIVGATRWIVKTATVTRWLNQWLKSLEKQGESESEDMDITRKRLLGIVFEAFRHGSAGLVHEARLLTHDWGFRFEDVVYDKVMLWHGTKDTNAPISQIRYLAAKLPHHELVEYDSNHYILGVELLDVVKCLVPEVLECAPTMPQSGNDIRHR